MRSKYRKQIMELMIDILEHNLRIKHFVLLQGGPEKYIVLDGNRRIFVLKFILQEKFREEIESLNPSFFNSLNKIRLKYIDQVQKVARTFNEECSRQVEPTREEASITLERHHSNKKEDGKARRHWPTWEERIASNQPEALFLFNNFKEYQFTILLEEINPKPFFKYTQARNMLRSPIFREWLMVEKLPNGNFISNDKWKTETRILSTVFFIFKNKVDKPFYNKQTTAKTLEFLKQQTKNKNEDFVDNVLIKLQQIKEQLQSSQSIDKQESTSIISKPTKPIKRIWFPRITPLLKNSDSAKLYELVNSINEIPKTKLKKIKLLCFLSIRPIIEMFVNKYFNNLKKRYFNNLRNEQNKLPLTLKNKIQIIRSDISKSEFSNKVDLAPLDTIIENNIINELNKILHQKNDFFVFFDNLEKKIQLVDAFGETIEQYLVMYNN